jgi:multimeric flavodoxin WrbA
MYGHVEKLAQEIEKGASSVEGVEVKLFQVWVCQIVQYHTEVAQTN